MRSCTGTIYHRMSAGPKIFCGFTILSTKIYDFIIDKDFINFSNLSSQYLKL